MDKRQSLRRELRVKATLTVGGEPPMAVQTMDIGKFGMGLVGILKRFPMGQEATVEFDMAAGRVALRTRIAYCIDGGAEGGYKAGLQFLDLESDAAALVAQYVG